MRKIYSLLIVILIYSCTSSEDQIEPNVNVMSVESLLADHNFIDFARAQDELKKAFLLKLDGLTDEESGLLISNIQSISDSEQSNQRLENLSHLLGFNTMFEFEIVSNELSISLTGLIQAYPQLADENRRKENFVILEEAFYYLQKNELSNNGRINNSCKEALDNCRASADADLALTTTACVGSLFIPVAGPFIGVACEAAGIYKHKTSYDGCNLDYQECEAQKE